MEVHRHERPPSCVGQVDFLCDGAGWSGAAERSGRRGTLRRAPTRAKASAVSAADTLSLVRFNGTERYAVERADYRAYHDEEHDVTRVVFLGRARCPSRRRSARVGAPRQRRHRRRRELLRRVQAAHALGGRAACPRARSSICRFLQHRWRTPPPWTDARPTRPSPSTWRWLRTEG